MARKRDISPDIWGSEQFLGLPSDTARLAFIACFSLADDLGLGRVADLRRHTRLDLAALEDVATAGLVTLYEIPDGRERLRLYFLPKWCRYQYVNRPSPSRLQLPPAWREAVPAEYHDRYARVRVVGEVTEPRAEHRPDSRRTHGGLTEPHLSPSPSPSPSPKKRRARRGSAAPAAIVPIESFPIEDRPIVEAIRSVALPAWRDDPNVTPAWLAALRAAAPGRDLVAVVRSAAAWWTSNPAKVRGRQSCIGTIRTFTKDDSRGGAPGRADAGPPPPDGGDVLERMRAEVANGQPRGLLKSGGAS